MNKSHFPWRYAVWRLSVSIFLVIWKGFLHILDLGLVFTRPWGFMSTSLNLRREEQLRITEVNLNLLFCCGHANPTSCWVRDGGGVRRTHMSKFQWSMKVTANANDHADARPGRACSVRISWHACGLFEACFVKSSVKKRKKIKIKISKEDKTHIFHRLTQHEMCRKAPAEKGQSFENETH